MSSAMLPPDWWCAGSGRNRLVWPALLPFVDTRGILPEVLFSDRAGLLREELLHQADFLRDRRDPVAVRVVRSEDHAILAEGLEQEFKPVAEEFIVLDDEAVAGARVIDLGQLHEDVRPRGHVLDHGLVGLLDIRSRIEGRQV